jgi:hypothetical protein
LQGFLEDIAALSIAAPAITHDKQSLGMRVLLAAVLLPPVSYAVTAKLAGVSAGVKVNISIMRICA